MAQKRDSAIRDVSVPVAPWMPNATRGLGTRSAMAVHKGSSALKMRMVSGEEARALESLLERWGSEVQDAVARSVAVLGAARLLSRRELSSRLRWVAIGARLGWISSTTATAAMDAFLSCGDQRMARLAGSAASEFDGNLDEWRARETVRIMREAGGTE